ncbi:MAG: hypothetical protein EXQ70_04010 [Solirubrobacterales bacterium]|nr:hypothetical protein [Solirubrobacterales bacterium]
MGDDERRLSILKAIVAFSVVSTTLHYTHNFVAIDRYPADLVPGPVTQVAIIVSWPLFTAIGLYGYRLYSERRYSTAHVCLLVYSMLGITTVGHFLDGSPDIAAFWYGTIFTDFLAGTALVVFTAASALVVRPKDGGLDAGDRVG